MREDDAKPNGSAAAEDDPDREPDPSAAPDRVADEPSDDPTPPAVGSTPDPVRWVDV